MNRVVRTALLAGVLAVGVAPAADQVPPPPATEDLIRDLADPVFTTRERTSELLWRRGRASIPALERAAIDANPEISRRAREVLDRFSWYVFPDTPADVLKQVAAFRAGTPDERKAALADLLKLGPHGRAAARAILSKDFPAGDRDPLATHLTTLLRREVPLLLFDGKPDEAADRLTLHTAGTTPEGAADYAAFQVLRDTLPAAVAEAESLRKTSRRPEAADLLLAHLYRASRDWPKARRAAAAIDRARADRTDNDPNRPAGNTLVRMLLEEEGDWPALLKDPPPLLNLPDAYRLTFLRLAGKEAEIDAEAKRVRASVAAEGSREEVREAAVTLLLNDRAADATDLLLEHRQNFDLLAELLIARMRYKDAFALLDKGKGEPSFNELVEFGLRRARLLMIVGRRDEAVKQFAETAAAFKSVSPAEAGTPSPPPFVRSLLRSELRVGLRDLACDHAATFVDGQPVSRREANEGETVFDILFGTDAEAAEHLYRLIRPRRTDAADAGRAMREVRDLLAGIAAKATADDAIKVLSAEGPGEAVGGRSEFDTSARKRKVTRLTALAGVCRGARRYDEAEAAFAAAADAASEGPDLIGARAWVFGTSDAYRPWLEYADYLASRGRHADAAAKFEAGWKRFPDQPLLLFLSGRALTKAGNAAEGSRRMDLSHWVALGNERARGKFLEELVRRGEAAAAKRETDLLLRACWSRDFYFGNVMNQAARAAALAKDWPTAERCVQRSLLVLVKTPGVQFVDTSANVHVPHEMSAFRARGLLAAGKAAEAMAQARAFLDVTPGHVELVVGMVPDLDQLGRKADADELFGRVRAAYQKVLTDYPDSPAARNALATLGAGCRRELDQSLEYATEAITADPKSSAFRETLAEVHFRRGDRSKALAVMTLLAEEHPRNNLYRRQLARYKSGDVDSPIPATEE